MGAIKWIVHLGTPVEVWEVNPGTNTERLVVTCESVHDARQIIREHNAHEELVKTLEECKHELGYYERTFVGLARFSVQEKIKKADAALAMAKEDA